MGLVAERGEQVAGGGAGRVELADRGDEGAADLRHGLAGEGGDEVRLGVGAGELGDPGGALEAQLGLIGAQALTQAGEHAVEGVLRAVPGDRSGGLAEQGPGDRGALAEVGGVGVAAGEPFVGDRGEELGGADLAEAGGRDGADRQGGVARGGPQQRGEDGGALRVEGRGLPQRLAATEALEVGRGEVGEREGAGLVVDDVGVSQRGLEGDREQRGGRHGG